MAREPDRNSAWSELAADASSIDPVAPVDRRRDVPVTAGLHLEVAVHEPLIGRFCRCNITENVNLTVCHTSLRQGDAVTTRAGREHHRPSFHRESSDDI